MKKGLLQYRIQYTRKTFCLIVREYNLYQWEAQLKVIVEIVGET